MSISDLQKAMVERHIPTAGCFEKQDLIDALRDWEVRYNEEEDRKQKEGSKQRTADPWEQSDQQKQQYEKQQAQQRSQQPQQPPQEASQQAPPQPLPGQTDYQLAYEEQQSYMPPPSGIDKFDVLQRIGFKRAQAIYIDEEGDLTGAEYEGAADTVQKAETLGFKKVVLIRMFADYPQLFKVDWKRQMERLTAANLEPSYVHQICMQGYPLLLLEEQVVKVEEFSSYGFNQDDISKFVKEWKNTHVNNEETRVTVKGKVSRARE
jgi:hypothetical protein